ncbi:MAG: NAD+ synthase [Candidatus Hydrogenedentota bacterium]|nr:MAG: NAD+ synthase [Candidatus Hydrogenedentota bacterium]
MITDILKDEVIKTGTRKVVVGLSGGIDSALSYRLATLAFGTENVLAILMPYKLSSSSSIEDALELLKQTGGQYEKIEITSMADAYFHSYHITDKLRMGNVLARLRMIVLYDISARENALVIGTSNKTEMLLGYSTLWGDMASAVNPIGDLYKTQVRALARYLDIPKSILDKPPSADLWEGQSDEKELQTTYDFADRILYAYTDQMKPETQILKEIKTNIPEQLEVAKRLMNRIKKMQYKRKLPIIVKLSHRTIGREFRYPRDWNL